MVEEIQIWREMNCPFCGKCQRINQWSLKSKCEACGKFFIVEEDDWNKDGLKSGDLS